MARRRINKRIKPTPTPTFTDDLVDVQFAFDGMRESNEQIKDVYCAAEFPDQFRIPKSEWKDRAAENDKHKSWAENYSGRFTNQNPSHECVCHASQQVFMACFNRQYGSLKDDIWFSPLALYTRITGGRQWGGSNVLSALQEMMEVGMIPDDDGPKGLDSQKKRFAHTVHTTSGSVCDEGWIRPQDLPDGWKATAKCFRVLEAYKITDREAHASSLLHGWGICNGRSGHSIPHLRLVWRDGVVYSKYKDSYDVYRYDSERMWGGGYCIRSVTMPEDIKLPCPMLGE